MPNRIFVIVEPITNLAETITLEANQDRPITEQELIDLGFTTEQLDTFMSTGRVLETTFGFPPPLPPVPPPPTP